MVMVDEQYDFPRNLVGYGQSGLNKQWPNGARIAVSLCVNYELSLFHGAIQRIISVRNLELGETCVILSHLVLSESIIDNII